MGAVFVGRWSDPRGAGDFWLSRDGDRAFLIGLVSFALAHLAYIGLLWQFGAVAQMSVWAIAIGLLACGMALVLWPRAGTCAVLSWVMLQSLP